MIFCAYLLQPSGVLSCATFSVVVGLSMFPVAMYSSHFPGRWGIKAVFGLSFKAKVRLVRKVADEVSVCVSV